MSDDVKLLMTPLKTKEDLNNWCLIHLGFELPGTVVSRFSDCTPLDFVWDAYRAIMDGYPLAEMALAGRDSVKTLGLAVIDLLALLHDERHTVHIAMTTAQGQRAKTYLTEFINRNQLLKDSIVKANTKEITLNVNGEAVGMEILPASPRAVQGAHSALTTFDELSSSMSPDNVKAYKDAHGIGGTSRKGKPAIIIKITSRQAGYSLAEQELKNAAATGLIIRKWTSFENTERCPDSRSGIIPTPLMISYMKGETYTKEEFIKKYPKGMDGFELINTTFDGCAACPIASLCQGDLKKQESKSILLRTIDDIIQKIRLAGSHEWALAQIMSLKASTEGLVYWEWDRSVHVPGWNAMWERLTGINKNDEVTREQFINELKKRGANFYAGLDWGFSSSPSVAVVMAVDRRGYMYVVEAVAKIRCNDPAFIQEVVLDDLQPKYDIQMWCPDLANGSGRDILKQSGVPTTDDIDKTVSLGINLVKGVLRVPGTNGETRVMFAPDLDKNMPLVQSGGANSSGHKLENIYEEFELYHNKIDSAGRIQDMENPVKEYDHFLDGYRYLIYWLIGRQRAQVGESAFTPKEHHSERRNNVPSQDQLLTQQGIPFIDNREEYGLPTNKPENDDGNGSSEPGGAIWSWS